MYRLASNFQKCSAFSKTAIRVCCPGLNSLRQASSSKKQSCEKPKENKKQPLMDIKGKIAIITGGSSGIGLAAAEQLLTCGAEHVFISSTDCVMGTCAEKELNEKYGDNKASFIFGDVRDDDCFKELFETAIERYENVDILFNNAGILKDKLWKETVDINFTGSIRGCFFGFKYMGKNECGKGGIIINCASIVGLQPLPGAPVYSSTKYGIIGVTVNFGDHYHCEETGIRVTAVCPGVTETALVNEAKDQQYKQEWGAEAQKFLTTLPRQGPEALGKAVACIVKWAPTATIWVVEDNKLYRADIPDRSTFGKLIMEIK